jgi:asparagine synthase (glutamine-hydrolysing)
MSGLVAFLSADPGVLAAGADALARLRHIESLEVAEIRAEGVYLGVCGRPREISLAEDAGGEGGAPARAALAGEVYNVVALRRELGLIADASAAAVLLAAHRRWGDDLFARFEGAFAAVVYDAGARRVLAAPDTWGVTYLHCLTLGDDVLVATECKAFYADPRFKPSLNLEAASCVVALGHEFGHSLFAGVQAVPQGHHAVIADGAVRMARHWDAREVLGTLRGEAYLDRMQEAIEELCADVFGGGTSLLPLTGGLDSRMLAAARPREAHVDAFSFGTMDDSDCVRGEQIARACGMTYEVIPFETDYVARHAAETVWLTEGRLTPAENTTGMQMPALAGRDQFVSGVDCGLARRFSKSKTFFPDWSLVGPDTPAFDSWLHLRFARSGMSPEEAELAFGPHAGEARQPGVDALSRYIGESRGHNGVDRIDLYFVGGRSRGWRASGLNLAGVWIPARAPFLTRRWIDAVLAGAPDERLDDLPRVALIRRLDPAVALVPWVMTLMPLRESEYALRGLKQASRLSLAWKAWRGERGHGPGAPAGGEAAAGRAPSAARQAATKRYMAVVKGAYHRIYNYGDHRDEWLRGPSRAFVEDVLLSERHASRGYADGPGVRRLLEEHMAGQDHTLAISILLGLELWSRLFVDGDPPPAVPEGVAREG